METYNQLSHSETGMRQPGVESEVHAYVLVIPKMEGPVLETLQKLFAALSTQEPVVLPLPSRKAALEVVDSWLEHSAAAEYLGVGRSTLYRYSEHHEIESRKFCGRLQYRLSSLDEFQSPSCAAGAPFGQSQRYNSVGTPAPVNERSADGTLSETWFTLLVDDIHHE